MTTATKEISWPRVIPLAIRAKLTCSEPAAGRVTGFMMYGDRYAFDCNLPSRAGWSQLDTKADAGYYGHWGNPFRRQILSYVEGDVTLRTLESDELYSAAVQEWADWSLGAHGEAGKIDGMCNEELKAAWVGLGLGDLLH